MRLFNTLLGYRELWRTPVQALYFLEREFLDGTDLSF
jgi:hypothetical protein